jgi:hypothetical protein
VPGLQPITTGSCASGKAVSMAIGSCTLALRVIQMDLSGAGRFV